MFFWSPRHHEVVFKQFLQEIFSVVISSFPSRLEDDVNDVLLTSDKDVLKTS